MTVVVGDLPIQYRQYINSLTKGTQRLIDIIDDATEGITGSQKANRIAKIHALMQQSVTQIEKMLITDTSDVEEQMDAEILVPLDDPE
jgi:hypothetical protein